MWPSALQLHTAIAGERNGGVGAGVSPKTALSVGLKVDARWAFNALSATPPLMTHLFQELVKDWMAGLVTDNSLPMGRNHHHRNILANTLLELIPACS